MIWTKNLLFISLCLFGLVALASNLYRLNPKSQQPIVVELPEHSTIEEVVQEVNRSLESQWAANKIKPADRAEDLIILRRLSLALTGTVPSLEEIRQIEALPAETNIIDYWLSRIFADRRSSDYLAERFSRALVGVESGPFIVYRRNRFSSWLSDQFQENRPYNELMQEIITSRGLWTDKPATNFVTVSIVENNDPDETKLIGKVSRAMLGMRLDCAQCHDHPFDDWTYSDFPSTVGLLRVDETNFYWHSRSS